MSNETKLVGESRESLGSRASQKLRSQGRVPGSLYGLGKDPVSFSVESEGLRSLVYGGVQVVGLEIEGESELSIFRDVQWDTFSRDIWHVDLLRIDPTKRLSVELSIELRGTSPGVLAGGVLDQSLRVLSIECLSHQIPEHFFVRINALQIGDAIHVSDLEVPEGATILDDPEALVVRVNAPVDESAEDVGGESPIEPELVGKKPEGDEGD